MGTTLSRAGGAVIRVLLVSPSSGTRRALEHVVAQDPGLVIVGASGSLQSLDDVIDQSRPEVIVLDPGPESHLPLPLLLEQRPSRHATPLVVLLEDLESEVGARALRAGAQRPSSHLAFQILRSEEHTSELQSRSDLVCRLLLEKKKR